MKNITILRKMIKGKELVLISRTEYERLKMTKGVKMYTPTASEKKDLVRARKNRAQGKFFTIDEFKRKLGFTD